MEIIKRKVLKTKNYEIGAEINLPMLLVQSHNGNGVLSDYNGDTMESNYPKDNDRLLITGYCESRLEEVEIYGIGGYGPGLYNKVGEMVTPYGEKYDAYSGVMSVTDTEITYIINTKLDVNGIPDVRYGIMYVDTDDVRNVYNDYIEKTQSIPKTIFKTYSYGVNKNNFIINDIQFKDQRNGNLVEPLKVDSSAIIVDRGEVSIIEKHENLNTIKSSLLI